MKKILLLMSACSVLLFGGCAQSLLTDEEYQASHGPGPRSPDPTGYIPQSAATASRPAGF
ncbi:MAG: hypothetical protein DLM73_14825 [Chthoniobacterales bacterium]|nr:MAG: hypothetical protein DLM73_14825 [Chthoniobacterales bacterium]